LSIRILNCAAMSPWFPRWRLGVPCLLVETDQGCVLVDTGLGLHDYQRPSKAERPSTTFHSAQGDPLPAADEWSDLDLIFFTTAIQAYAGSGAWLEQFGECWLSWLDNTGQGYPEWFAIYAGGLKLDIALVSHPADIQESSADLLEGFAHRDVLFRGVHIMLDRTDFTGELPIYLYTGQTSPPTDEEFKHLTGRFWINAVKAAKFIQRGEAWRAKQAVDGELKEYLLRLLEWHARCVYRPRQNTWYDGRLIDHWADPRSLEVLPAAFADYELIDMQRALLANIDLYSWLAAELGDALGYLIINDNALFTWVTNTLA
jgi:aminoglycoside 6-adenylyltransferase